MLCWSTCKSVKLNRSARYIITSSWRSIWAHARMGISFDWVHRYTHVKPLTDSYQETGCWCCPAAAGIKLVVSRLVTHLSYVLYRARQKGVSQVARILQARPGRSGKQEQEQNSRNLGTAFLPNPVHVGFFACPFPEFCEYCTKRIYNTGDTESSTYNWIEANPLAIWYNTVSLLHATYTHGKPPATCCVIRCRQSLDPWQIPFTYHSF